MRACVRASSITSSPLAGIYALHRPDLTGGAWISLDFSFTSITSPSSLRHSPTCHLPLPVVLLHLLYPLAAKTGSSSSAPLSGPVLLVEESRVWMVQIAYRFADGLLWVRLSKFHSTTVPPRWRLSQLLHETRLRCICRITSSVIDLIRSRRFLHCTSLCFFSTNVLVQSIHAVACQEIVRRPDSAILMAQSSL